MMTGTLEFSVATADEWKEVLEVIKDAYNEYANASDPEFWSMYQQSIEQAILNDQSITRIVAKEGSKILGAVVYCPPYEKKMGNTILKNPYPEMRLLAVPVESRNRGIAAKLIDFCEEKARASGSSTITLHTTVLMQVAKQMYERRGYVRYPDIDFNPVPTFVIWGYRKDFAS